MNICCMLCTIKMKVKNKGKLKDVDLTFTQKNTQTKLLSNGGGKKTVHQQQHPSKQQKYVIS